MYELIFDDDVIEFLETCEKQLAQRIWKKLQTTIHNPFHYFERLHGRKDYKLRIGDYRAIADIHKEKKRIEITLIGHRKNIYQNLK